MEPDELLQKLKALGHDVARPTLPRWVKQGLIPAPTVRSLGRGRGAQSLYPTCVLAEAYAAAVLLRVKGCKVREVAFVRQSFRRFAAIVERGSSDKEAAAFQETPNFLEIHPAGDWPILVAKVAEGWAFDRPAEVSVLGMSDDGCIKWELRDAEQDYYVPWLFV